MKRFTILLLVCSALLAACVGSPPPEEAGGGAMNPPQVEDSPQDGDAPAGDGDETGLIPNEETGSPGDETAPLFAGIEDTVESEIGPSIPDDDQEPAETPDIIQLSPPVVVVASRSDSPTLGVPRWKGYVSESNSDHLWISFGTAWNDTSNLKHSTDGGETWVNDSIRIDDGNEMNYHLSTTGRTDGATVHLYFTWLAPDAGSIRFRRISYTGEAIDYGSVVTLMNTGGVPYSSNIMVGEGGRIWVFTRRGDDDQPKDVRYWYSDDEGATWTSGLLLTSDAGVRLGAMPFVGDDPVLTVLRFGTGYDYYRWDGSDFIQEGNHSIYAADMGFTRDWTQNHIGSQMHLIFGLENRLYHTRMTYTDGGDAWSASTAIDSDPQNNTMNNDWLPITTVQGDRLYVFYCKKSSSDAATSMIYVKRWNQTSETWTDPLLVSTDAGNVNNQHPNTVFQVPDNADYIPVFWTSGDAPPYSINFSKVLVGDQ